MSRRYAIGMPLELALAGENNPKINLETWKKALQAHAELAAHYDAAKADFLEQSMERLAGEKDTKYLCYLLERRFSDLFAKPAAVSVSVNTNTTIAGVPDDVLERARVVARAEAKVGPPVDVPKPKSKRGK